MKCPRCGREGKPAVKRVRSKGREYWYRVVRHPDGMVCVVGRLSEREVEEKRARAGRRAYELLAASYLIDALAEEVAEYRRALRAAVEAVAVATRLVELYSSSLAKIAGSFAVKQSERSQLPERAHALPLQLPREEH